MVDDDSDITEIKGIGPATAEDLSRAGFETVGDVASASAADLTNTDGFDRDRAQDIHGRAIELLTVEDSDEDEVQVEDPDDSSESVESRSEEDQGEEDADPSEESETDEADSEAPSGEEEGVDPLETELDSSGTPDNEANADPDPNAVTGSDVDGHVGTDALDDEEKDTHTVDLEYDENINTHVIAALVELEIGEYKRKQNDRVEAIRELQHEFEGAGGEVSLEVTDYQLNALYRAVNQRQQEYHSNRGVAGMTGKLKTIADQVQEARSEYLF